MDKLNALYVYIENLRLAGILSAVQAAKLSYLAKTTYEEAYSEGHDEGWHDAEEAVWYDGR